MDLSDHKNILNNLRSNLLANNNLVRELEMTSNNYDNYGNLLENDLPTITTNFCEIGIYNDIMYFTFIIFSENCNKKLFDDVKDIKGVLIYPFVNFENILYPKGNFKYNEFESEIKKEKYLQINFDLKFKNVTVEKILKKYYKFKDIFIKNNINVINQLDYNF